MTHELSNILILLDLVPKSAAIARLIRDKENLMESTQYDRDMHVFKAFLDPYMKFSSGLFQEQGTPFEIGMRDQLDHLIEQANIVDGMKILEVGTGWGCLLKRIQERFDGVQYVGVSPSHAQSDYVQENVDTNVQIHRATFEQSQVDGRFDAIFLSGTFCHLSNKFNQIARLSEMLLPCARLVIEDTFFVNEKLMQQARESRFKESVQEGLFGWADLVPLSRALEMSEAAGLKPRYLKDMTNDYSLTGRHWIQRLARADLSYGKKKNLLAYLRFANMGWNEVALCYLLVLEKR